MQISLIVNHLKMKYFAGVLPTTMHTDDNQEDTSMDPLLSPPSSPVVETVNEQEHIDQGMFGIIQSYIETQIIFFTFISKILNIK